MGNPVLPSDTVFVTQMLSENYHLFTPDSASTMARPCNQACWPYDNYVSNRHGISQTGLLKVGRLISE